MASGGDQPRKIPPFLNSASTNSIPWISRTIDNLDNGRFPAYDIGFIRLDRTLDLSFPKPQEPVPNPNAEMVARSIRYLHQVIDENRLNEIVDLIHNDEFVYVVAYLYTYWYNLVLMAVRNHSNNVTEASTETLLSTDTLEPRSQTDRVGVIIKKVGNTYKARLL